MSRKSFLCVWLTICLLGAAGAEPLYAQKWKILQKSLSSAAPRAGASLVAAPPKWSRLIRTIQAAVRSRPLLNPTVWKANGSYYFHSPALLLPPYQALRNPHDLPQPFPFPISETELYRGMALDKDGQELRHILTYGLETSKSHFDVADKSYDGKIYPPGTKGIYATTLPLLAQEHIVPRNGRRPVLPVILHLKRVGTQLSIAIAHDVPPAWIYRVSALLQIEGELVWGELKLGADNQFIFTPYPAR